MQSTRFLTTSFSLLILGSLVITGIFLLTAPVLAATPKPSASPTPLISPSPSLTPDSDTTQKLKDRIDKVIEQRRDQVRGVSDQASGKKRGFIGEVQRVTEQTMTLKTRRGTQILTIDENVILNKENKKATLDEIAVGDWAIALGYMNEEDFLLRKVLDFGRTLQPVLPATIIGKLETNTSSTQLTFVNVQDDQKMSVTLPKTVELQDTQGNPIDRKKLTLGGQYLIIATGDEKSPNDTNVKVAKIIRALP